MAWVAILSDDSGKSFRFPTFHVANCCGDEWSTQAEEELIASLQNLWEGGTLSEDYGLHTLFKKDWDTGTYRIAKLEYRIGSDSRPIESGTKLRAFEDEPNSSQVH